MTKTNRDELKSTNDSELPLMAKGSNDSELPLMAKGSKSSTRGDDEKAIVRVADSDVENKDKNSSGTVAKESEPGKLLGQHVAEGVGRVPMKKRRNMVPSLSPGMSSGGRGISEHRSEINHVSKLSPKDDSSCSDFSGIAFLADTACNLSNDVAPGVDRLPAEEPVVQQKDGSTILPHAVDSTDQVGQGKDDTVAPQKNSFDVADEKGMEHIIVSVGASESENSAPDGGVVIKSEKSSVSEPTKKKNLRLHWDLNVSMDAWGPPCDVEDDASEKDVEGAIIKPMPPRESEPIDESKDRLNGFAVSAEQEKFSSPFGTKVEAAARNGNEFKSGYNSPIEDGELREPYRWVKNEVEDGETEPEDEGLYPMDESHDNKMKDSGKRIMEETNLGPLKSKSHDAIRESRDALRSRESHDALRIRESHDAWRSRESHDALRIRETYDRRDIEKNDVACVNDLYLKKRSSSSSSRSVSKPLTELSSHDAIPRRRYDDHEEFSMDPYKSSERHDRSSSRGYVSGSGSRPRYVLEPRRPDDRRMMGGLDQSRSWSGQGSQSDGYVRNRFSNEGYCGGRFSNGGNRVMRDRHGDNNQVSGRMSGNRRGRGNSPVFRRPRSRSPVPWNGRGRSSQPHDGFRAEERMMERERFLEDQEIGFTSPPRNRMPPPRFVERRSYDSGANHNSFRERRFGPGGQRHDDAGSPLRRMNSDDRYNYIPFRRQRRFDDEEDNTGGNRFEMRQQQSRRSDVREDGGDDVQWCSQQQEERRRQQRG